MKLSLSRMSATPSGVEVQPPVYVVKMSGRADRLGIDNAYDAIMRLSRERGAHVVADVARVQSRTDAEPMLVAARAALPGRFSIVGT